MKGKRRLSVSVRPAWIEAAQTAVAGGQAPSVSAWVDDALRLKVDHDRRLAALAAFLESYENTHGVITDEEVRDAARRARSRAVTVRGPKTKRRRVG
jgi:hypothetical protein